MKKFYVLTLFPEMILNAMSESIIGRAIEDGYIDIKAINIRDYTIDKHGHVDDYPYGGGAGMLMQVQPICDAYKSICDKISRKPKVYYMSPSGNLFNQQLAKDIALEEDTVILCGHYEGIDQRALDRLDATEISIGDYVLTGGELPAMVVIDTVSRMVPGVLTNEESGIEESFADGLLEYPQYTRPEEYDGMRVPDILLSGHHKNIENWRRNMSIERTYRRRPDLLKDANLSQKELEYIKSLANQ